MSDTRLEKLSKIFQTWPGIGPRQARRFVHHLLEAPAVNVRELLLLVNEIKKSSRQCPDCQRFFLGSVSGRCPLCLDHSRDQTTLLIVEKDIDLEAIEKANHYRGRYFVLGELKDPWRADRSLPRLTKLRHLIERQKKSGLKEIVIALSTSPEGDETASVIRRELAGGEGAGLIISQLGRGLSSGAELEYADPLTLKEAFIGRR